MSDVPPEVASLERAPRSYGDLDKRLWLTERGNGIRLARKLGRQELIYVPGPGWYSWQQTEWVQAEEIALRSALELSDDLLGDVARIAAGGGDGAADKAKAIATWAKRSARPATGRATLDAAAGLGEVRVVADQLDRDPHLLNFRNGVVDLRTGVLRPHDPQDFLTYTIPVNYDPNATCPRWRRFLEEVLDDSSELVTFVHKALGYSMSARQEEQCAFFLRGEGSNGKNNLLDTIEAAGGRYVHRANETLLVARAFDEHSTEVADLRGRRLVIAAEVGRNRKWNTQRVKNLVGERTLKARYMRRDFFTFSATHHLWITSNHFPAVEDHTHAFWRRLRLVPFRRTFPLNRDLPGELLAELPGILAWLVEGYRRWEVEGLGEPVEVREAVADYRRRSDTLGLFIQECCALGEHLEAPAAELFNAYSVFCAERALARLAGQQFKIQLLDHGHMQRTLKGHRFYRGLALAG